MNFYLRAFLIFFRIGLFTIGGGYAMVPLIEADLVDKRKWVKKEDFLDLMALAQTVPGIFAVNIAIFIGYKLKGFLGSFLDGSRYHTSLFSHHPGYCSVFQTIPTCRSCKTCVQRHPSCGSSLDCSSYLQNGKISPYQPIQYLDSGGFSITDMASWLFAYLRHHPQRIRRLLVWTLPKEI